MHAIRIRSVQYICHRKFCSMLISADGISAHATLSIQFYGFHVFCPRWHAYDLARTVDIIDIACNLYIFGYVV